MKLILKLPLYFVWLLSAMVITDSFAMEKSKEQAFQSNTLERNELQDQARKLAKQGDYEGALAKYQQALAPGMANFEWQEGPARGGIKQVYIYQKKYDKALETLQWHLESNPEKYEHERLGILALLEYSEAGNPEPIKQHIKYMHKTIPTAYPPHGVGEYYVAKVLFLFDTIGDHNAGIAYIDEILSFLRGRRKEKGQDYQFYDEIKTVADADKIMKWRDEHGNRHPMYHGAKFVREYLLVREAFEQDKAEGTKGRATKALIQSDYFPW